MHHSIGSAPPRARRSADKALTLRLLSTVGGAILAAAAAEPSLAQNAAASADASPAVVAATAAAGDLIQGAAGGQPPASSPPPPTPPSKTAPINEVVVTGTIQRTGSVNNIPVPVIETTQALNVMTTEDLRLASVTTFNDIGRLDSGTYQPGSRAGFTQLYFRGFISTFSDFPLKIDGFRSDEAIIPEMYIYDSVQVYLGAAATNYGQSDPGGVEIAVSKSPKDHFGGEASVEAGSYDHYGVNFDVYGPITSDGKLSARLVGVDYTQRSAFDYLGEKRWTLAPSLRWKPTEQDEFLFLSSYSQSWSGASVGFGLALNPNGPGGAANQANYIIPQLPFSKLGDSAPWARLDKNYDNASLTYTHTFKGGFVDGWKLKIGVDHDEINTPDSKWAWVGDFAPISTVKTSKTNLYLYWGTNVNHAWAGEINLLGDFQALGHTQTFSIGADYTDGLIGYHPYIGTQILGANSGFSIYQNNWNVVPGYSSPSQMVSQYGQTFSYSFNRRDINYGEEAQLLLHPIDKLTINLGGRFSMSEETEQVQYGYPETNLNAQPYNQTRPDEHDWTYQTGASYAVLKHLNAYVSYGTTFEAGSSFAYDPSNPDSVGTFLGNVLGRTYEVGVKGEAPNRSYNWSFDVYDTAVTNAFQTDPAHPKFALAEGAEEAKGWEFEFKGVIKPGWTLLVSASSGWNVFTGGELKGFTSPFLAKFGLSTFTTYEIQGGPLKGLGFGGGLVLKTMPTPSTYSYDAEGNIHFLEYKDAFNTHQAEVDLRVFYDLKPWRFELSGTNVLDDRYANPRFLNTVEYEVFMNEPFMAMARITRSF
jgi:iron complex outermembrane receptor protein